MHTGDSIFHGGYFLVPLLKMVWKRKWKTFGIKGGGDESKIDFSEFFIGWKKKTWGARRNLPIL